MASLEFVKRLACYSEVGPIRLMVNEKLEHFAVKKLKHFPFELE